jgi:DNA polymerase III delta subunit
MLSHRVALDKGADLEKILADIRNPQARQEMGEQLKSYQRAEYDTIFREFLKLDEQIKTGRQHWDLLLQTTILKICRK